MEVCIAERLINLSFPSFIIIENKNSNTSFEYSASNTLILPHCWRKRNTCVWQMRKFSVVLSISILVNNTLSPGANAPRIESLTGGVSSIFCSIATTSWANSWYLNFLNDSRPILSPFTSKTDLQTFWFLVKVVNSTGPLGICGFFEHLSAISWLITMPPSCTCILDSTPTFKELVLLSFFPTAASDADIPFAQEAIEERRIK